MLPSGYFVWKYLVVIGIDIAMNILNAVYVDWLQFTTLQYSNCNENELHMHKCTHYLY